MQRGRPGQGGGGGTSDRGQPVRTDSRNVALRPMQIFVELLSNDVFLVDVMPEDNIYHVKEQMQVKMLSAGSYVPATAQRLHYDDARMEQSHDGTIPAWYQLENSVSLRELAIQHGDTLVLRWVE